MEAHLEDLTETCETGQICQSLRRYQMNQLGCQNFRVLKKKGTCQQTYKPEVYGFNLSF
ncbi:2238_t:CDS:2 [Cetraspora pellucida]|uniref:2238_t:CDS:1 n=1 Tax=Cetraspora pellucida TaxID=1433469 RepID=A0A9N9EGX9_9GLOM|nr:2238_t:CDS:2 [Cetraspora pellucida]